jgi:type IV pilus assembly protein PilV
MAQHLSHAEYRIDSRRRYLKGSSLLEVLVSILIVSLGLAAMMGMQMFSQAANKNAVNRGAAITLANELADMMRANPGGFANRGYDLGTTPYFDGTTYAPTTATAACTYPCGASPATTASIATAANQVATDDLNYFRQHVRSSLPAGGFHVQTLGTAPVLAEQADIWIIWNEAAVLNSNVSTTSATGVVTTTSSESNIDDCPPNVTNARCIRFRVNL